MTCTVKICYGKWCLVLIHSNVQAFEGTEFAQSIGYKGDVNSMDISGLSAEPELESEAPAKDVPSTAEVSVEIGTPPTKKSALGSHLAKTFEIEYDKAKTGYVWSQPETVQAWFAESATKVGGLQNSSLTAWLEGFDEFPEVASFTIKNKGTAIAHVKR